MSQEKPIEDRGRLGLVRRRFLQLAGTAGTGILIGGRIGPSAEAALEPAANLKGRAIVLGLNDYKNAKPLVNPVLDACRFTEWLVSKAGVEPGNIALLTSPGTLPPGVHKFPAVTVDLATRANILKTIKGFPNRAGEKERLYFYYSGHGTAFQPKAQRGTIDQMDAIVPCDFSVDEPAPVPISWILDFLRTSRFVEQFYFFDACRNLDKTEPQKPPGDLPDVRFPIPVQYVLYATAPRRVALESETGSFTDLLLSSLTQGRLLNFQFDRAKKKYLVRWNALVEFLRQQFKDHPKKLGEEAGEPVFQQPEPRIIEDLDIDYPYLVELAEKEVPKYKLTINILPPELRPKTRITITEGVLGDSTLVVDRKPLPVDRPEEFDLPPGFNYQVLAEADGTALRRLSGNIPFNKDETITLTLASPAFLPAESLPADAVAIAAAAPIARDGNEEARPRSAPVGGAAPVRPGIPLAAPAPANGSRASLTLIAPDELTQIELADASGSLVRGRDGRPYTALGRLVAAGLKPGLYQARFYGADGHVTERIVALGAGVQREVSLEPQIAAAAPPIAVAIARAIPNGPDAERPRGLEELSNPAAQAAVKTGPAAYLVQAMRAMDNDPSRSALFAKNLGLRPFPAPEGLRIVLGVNVNSATRPSDPLKRLRVLLGGLDEDRVQPLRPEPSLVEGLLVFTVPRPPGPYRLRVELPDDRAEYALVVLKDRLSQVIIQQQEMQEAEDRIYVTQFAPETRSAEPANSAGFFKFVRIERLQHALQNGQARGVSNLLRELEAAGVTEPIVSALDAYVATRQGDQERLRTIADALVAKYPELPDGHVARARFVGKVTEERLAYLAALDRGLPVLSLFTRLLREGADRFKLVHHRIPLLRRASESRIPDFLWTAWRPAGD